MIKRFRKITDDLYRGGAPSVKDVIKLHKLFGVNKIISLDKDAGERINRICELLEIKHLNIPLDGTKSSLINLLSNDLKKLLLDDGPTFIHCKEGKDRTGFLSALFKCKYMGVSLEEALHEAKKLGFGENVEPHFINLLENTLIALCKDDKETLPLDYTDIVGNQREYMQDGRSSALDHADRGSFAPYLSTTKQYPYDTPYNYIYDQSPTRENSGDIKLPEADGEIPLVGLYDNSPSVRGVGPVETGGGIINI